VFNSVVVSMIMLLKPAGSVFSVTVPVDNSNPLPSVVSVSTFSEYVN